MAELLFATKWIELLQNERGNAFVRMGDGVLMVPVTTNREVVLLREYSVAYGKNMFLLPGGAIDDGEDVEAAVNRELQEEIGFKAATINYLGDIHPHTKYLHWKFKVYLARNLSPSRLQGDEWWEMAPIRAPMRLLTAAITTGKIVDATVISALYLAQSFLASEGN